MANVSAGYNWVSGETVTPAKLNSAAAPTVVVADNEVTTAKILDANVTNAKLASDIDASKLTTGTLPIARIADGAVTQAKLASNVAGNGPAFRAWASSPTSVPHASNTKINLQTEDFDTANCFASSRFTPNVAGYYWISAGIRCESLLHGHAIISKNGTAIAGGSHANANMFNSTLSDLVYLNGTTDYVELFAYQSSGTTQNMGTGGSPSAGTWMSGFLARAA
jgi:hypothetical protein